MGKCTYRDELGKNCTKCGEYKLYEAYSAGPTKIDGRRSWCRDCCVKYSRQRVSDRKNGIFPPEKKDPFVTGVKKCSTCKEIKSIANFSPDGVYKSGKPKLASRCKPCQASYALARINKKRGMPADFKRINRTDGRSAAYGSTGVQRKYVRIKMPEHHRANSAGWTMLHIVVAEEKYGIKITEEFSVHHKNGDPGDNRPSNLELRVGQHGSHADAVDRLLVSDELRERAVELLRNVYGFTVIPPAKSKRSRRVKNLDQGDLFGAA